MNKKTRIFIIVLLMIFILQGCNYNDPIKADGAGFNLIDNLLVNPIAWALYTIGKVFGGSFGVGIILTTILVRTIAWPIYAKTNDMSLKMSQMQPDLDRLNAKYATRQDPASKQKQQMEMMAIYRKHGFNPLGCLMPFLQMPIFTAMYMAVNRMNIDGGAYAGKLETTFIGIDLSKGGYDIIAFIMAILVGGTMYLLQWYSQQKAKKNRPNRPRPVNAQAQNTEQTMKIVSYVMILMMAAMAFTSKALALYWIVGNIYSFGQTVFQGYLNELKMKKAKEKEQVTFVPSDEFKPKKEKKEKNDSNLIE